MAVLLYEKRERIAYITLNRPEVHNALSFELIQQLKEAWRDFREDPEVWVAIVTGAGDRAFTAGLDLREYREKNLPEVFLSFWRETAQGALETDLRAWKPLIAAVNGYCIAGGVTLAMLCDIRLASEKARFGYPEVAQGIPPAIGGIQLPRLVPLGIAMEMLLVGELIEAYEAYRIGLVNKVVKPEELMPTAEGMARRICANGPLAVRATKQMVIRGLSMSVEDGLRWSRSLGHIVHESADAEEGRRAFLEKRRPLYRGV